MSQILEYGRLVKPGVGVNLASPELAKALGIEGLLVMDVPAGSTAEAAGVRGTYKDKETGTLVLGDVIVAVDDK